MKHLSEDDLILYHYGEVDDCAPFREHLAGCPQCAGQYQQLERTLAAASELPVPERSEAYAAEVWTRLAPRLKRNRWQWLGMFSQPRVWALAAAMATLVVAAFLIGRLSTRPVPEQAQTTAKVRERILLVAVGDHLERSQMVLIELANAPAHQPLDISAEKGWAADLVDANRLYRQTAARSGDAGIATVLDDLERILLDISHSPSQLSPAELERIQQRIESQGILFKVRVIGSKVRAAEKAPPNQADRGTL